MKIDTRFTQKRPAENSTYTPLEISADVVKDFATRMYTQEQIAKRFRITRNTLMSLYGDAYNAGVDELLSSPKAETLRAMNDMKEWRDAVDPMTDRQNRWSDKDAPFDRFIVLSNKIERRYDHPDTEEVSTLDSMTSEDLDAAILQVAREKGWTPPKE